MKKAAMMSVLLGAVGAGSVDAAQIFSSFGPGAGYLATMYVPVNFYTSPEVIGTHLAFAFTVPSNSDYRLDAVEIAASWAGTKKNAEFSIYADVAGVPADDPLLVLATNPEVLDQAPDITVVSLPAPTKLALQRATPYWLAIAPASLDASSPADDFVELWLSADPDMRVLQTSRVWFGEGPWQAWYSPPFDDGSAPAFRVFASPVPVPPPGLLMLAPLSVIACLRGRRAALRAGAVKQSTPAAPDYARESPAPRVAHKEARNADA